jgi:hypothetical protein
MVTHLYNLRYLGDRDSRKEDLEFNISPEK